MTRNLPDTQGEADSRNLAIDRVGVRGLHFPVQIRELNGSLQHSVATVSLAVDLPARHKGTHMSRFVEALNSHGSVLDVRHIAGLPAELLRRLPAKRAHVEFRFPFFISKAAPVSGARRRPRRHPLPVLQSHQRPGCPQPARPRPPLPPLRQKTRLH
jgi:GTP cyclohydrolase I